MRSVVGLPSPGLLPSRTTCDAGHRTAATHKAVFDQKSRRISRSVAPPFAVFIEGCVAVWRVASIESLHGTVRVAAIDATR